MCRRGSQRLGGLRLLIGTVAIAVQRGWRQSSMLGHARPGSPPQPQLAERLPGAAARAARYHAPTRFIVSIAIIVATGVLMLQFWGADAVTWFEGDRIGARLLSALITIAVAAVASDHRLGGR